MCLCVVNNPPSLLPPSWLALHPTSFCRNEIPTLTLTIRTRTSYMSRDLRTIDHLNQMYAVNWIT